MQVLKYNSLYYPHINNPKTKQETSAKTKFITQVDFSNAYYPLFRSNIKLHNITLNTELKNKFASLTEREQSNFKDLLNRFNNINPRLLLKAFCKNSEFRSLKPETIEKNVKDLVKRFEKENLSFDDYLIACTKQPSLFHHSSQTLEKNVRDFVKLYENKNLTVEKYLKACLRQPQLFYQSPQTIKANIINLVEKFENENLTEENYLKACLKQPSLFVQSADKIVANVRNLIIKFEKENLSLDSYLKACLKQPQLFHQSPNTIESNIRSLVEKYKSLNLSVEKYLKACLRQPSLFHIPPATIEKNIKSVVKNFEKENITLEKYIESALKNPSLFYLSPNTVTEHINAFIYIEKNKGHKINDKSIKTVLNRNLAYSTSLIYLKWIIEPQIKKQYPEIEKIKTTNIKNKLKHIFEQKPDMQFEIKILKDEMATNFIDIIKEFAKKELKSPNAFIIKQVELTDLQ